jgi:hypothetical protein
MIVRSHPDFVATLRELSDKKQGKYSILLN